MTSENDRKRKLDETTSGALLEKLECLERENARLKQQLSQFETMVTEEDSSLKRKIKSGQKKREQRSFDFTRYNKRCIALKLAYFGWDYHGFASQENIDTTIEAHLFNALTKSCLIEDRPSCNYSRCGRTDKGVSAFSQVISLQVRSNLNEGLGIIGCVKESSSRADEEINYVHILNKLLPDEIRILAWTPVPPDFSARFSCVSREYKYYFPAGNLDVQRMNAAAQLFLGEHDFRNFCKMDVGNVTSFCRNVLSTKVERIEDSGCHSEYSMCVFTVTGMAFLWHQVRCMTSILMLIGQHLEEPEVISYMLDVERCPRRPQYNMASEHPLVLFDCQYDKLQWIYHTDQLRSVFDNFQKLWTSHRIKTTMFRSLLYSLDNVKVEKETSKEENSSGVAWCGIKDNSYLGMSLIPSHYVKSYKPLSTRALCDSLETKLQNYTRKQQRQNEEAMGGDT